MIEEKIIKLYLKDKKSINSISKETGVSATQVRRILIKNNIERRSIKTNKDIENQIIKMYSDDGYSSEKISNELKINASTVCRILKRNNFNIKGAKYFNTKYKNNCSTIHLNNKYSMEILNKKEIPSINYGSSNIFSYNGVKLTHTNILKMNKDEKLKAANFVFNYLRDNGFPYPTYTDSDLIKDFTRLKKTSSKIENSILSKNDDSGLKIFKHFCWHYFNVSNSSLPSMSEAFLDDNRLMKVIYNRMGISYKETFNITGNMIRQGFRNSRQAFGASIFKPSIAKAIYDNFAPINSSVLDISAGFGHRMLGAMASNKVSKYTGLDPWIDTVNALGKINDFFEFKNSNIINIGSEYFVSEEKFDFCFSSPPFFNKEIYSNSSNQAYANKSFDQFIKEWWKPTVINTYNNLNKDSLFVLNMSEMYIDEMLFECRKYFTEIDKISINYKRKHLGKDGSDNFYVLKRL